MKKGVCQNLWSVRFHQGMIDIVEKPVPVPIAGEVLVKSVLAGICQTDMELLKGYYQFDGTPGHEFVGLVAEAPGNKEWEGKRIVADINWGCGKCRWCLLGDPRHCTQRRAMGIKHWDGAFAEYVVVPEANLHEVGQAITNEEAVFAEPLAAALEISRQVPIQGNRRVLVMGDGKLGLLIALALRHYHPGLVLLGKHPEKLAVAGKQGVKTKILGSREDLTAMAGQFDLVIEATGRAEGINDAVLLTRPEGTVVVKTTSHLPSEINLAQLVVNEITLIGSRCGNMDLALAFLKERRLDVTPLIEAIYPITEFALAFRHAQQPGAKKILLAMKTPS
jgi:threonine dehydrogenase-like Zn-dependent dehydrogenase